MVGRARRGQRREVTPRVLLLLLVALVPLVVILELGRPVTPVRVTGTPPVTTTFADGFRQHLGTVQEAAAALVDLGERRERNLLVVSQRQSAMNAALDATDAWLSQQPAQQSEPAVVAYRAGAAGIRQAMADAQSAFLRFDWVAIAAANDMLKQGVADISAAEDLLHSANGT